MSSPTGPLTLTPKWHSTAEVAALLGEEGDIVQ